MPEWAALGVKSRTSEASRRLAPLGAPGSAPSPPQPAASAAPPMARAAASSAATLRMSPRRQPPARTRRPSMTERIDTEHELLAFVEIPKGSRNKYEWHEEVGHVILDRFLSSSMVYPTDYGFLLGHMGRDGDPLDAMICVSEPTFPGCVIPVKPIALFVMQDEKGEDDKVVCVPTHDPGWSHAETLEDIPEQLQREITHFFSVYKQLEGKEVRVDGWQSREKALEVIADARRLQMEHDAPRRS